MTSATLIDIRLPARAGAHAPFAMHDADGAQIGFCQSIGPAEGGLLITGWTTRADAAVCCGGSTLPAIMAEARPRTPGGEAARAFRASVPAAASGFLVLRGPEGEDAFQWRSDHA